MKILLVTEYFYPQSSGGTELYVYNLAQELQNQQHDVVILSASDAESKQLLYNNLAINYIHFNHNFRTSVITGEEPADNITSFISAIRSINPEIIHFHTLTPSLGIHHISTARQEGFKVVLTSHIPSHVCIRGSLMRLGKYVCDGKVEEKKCLACYLQYRGLPEPFNVLAAGVIHLTGFPKNIAGVVVHKQNELQKMRLLLNHLVVVSDWQRAIFIKNSFDPQKISLCRQAIEINKKSSETAKSSKKLIVGFIGRITAIKGLHVLFAALKNVATENLELNIAAIPVETEMGYYHQQKQQAKYLPNINWIENLPNEKVGDFLQQVDVLCVPSQVLETGPFVVYEALAQGIPVLGSDLGGIAELISEGKNGWLFPHNDIKYLGLKIASFIVQKTNGNLLKNVQPLIRPIEMLAHEMLIIYQDILTENESSTSY